MMGGWAWAYASEHFSIPADQLYEIGNSKNAVYLALSGK